MLKSLIEQLKVKCVTIPNIKEVYAYPLQGDPKQYPAIIFYQTGVENTFESNNENFKIYTFSLFVVVNIAGSTEQKVYEEIMPKTFDDVVQHFDTHWDMASVDGHRVWARVSANTFGLSIEQKNRTATIEMTLQIKTVTNN